MSVNKKNSGAKDLLAQGIKILRAGDKETDELIAPRAAEIISLLENYIKEIELFNSAYSLVGAADTDELVVKHILDSLAPLGIICRLLDAQNNDHGKNNSASAGLEYSIADIGSGAGLPGIPLAIVLSDYNFTLIEKMKRRAGFLLNTQAALSLDNITTADCELETFAQIMSPHKTNSAKRGSAVFAGFDLITFRAFKPLEPKLLKDLLKIRAKRGIIAAYKGKREKIEAEMTALAGVFKEQKLKWEALPCPVPFLDEERHLAVIK